MANEQMLKELRELGHHGLGERAALWAVGEIERLRSVLSEITMMDGEQARHAAECALCDKAALRVSEDSK